MLLIISFFKPEKTLNINDEQKLFSAKNWRKLQTDAIFDYLPIYSDMPPGGPAPESPFFEKGEGNISNYQKGTDWVKFKAKVETEESQIRIPIFYFPQWTVLADGKVLDISYDNEFALLDINLDKGDYEIKAFLRDTPVRTVSNIISFLSWLFLIGFMLKYAYGKFRNFRRN